MTHPVFNRETLLDALVNVVPLFIIGFFLVLFLAIDPWGGSAVERALQFALLVVPAVLLAYLTYEIARRL